MKCLMVFTLLRLLLMTNCHTRSYELELMLENMENQVDKASKLLHLMKECEGKFYAGTCYKLLDDGPAVTYKDAVKLCHQDCGGELARIKHLNIYGTLVRFVRDTAYDFLMNEKRLGGDSDDPLYVHVWINEDLNYQGKNILEFEGEYDDFPIVWFPGFPQKRACHAKLGIEVKATYEKHEHVFNTHELHKMYPLCECTYPCRKQELKKA